MGGPRGVLNQHIFKVHGKDYIDEGWLYVILKSVTERIEGQAHGFKSTLVHVKRKDIDKQKVPLPPLPEQKKIAAILSTWDEAIEGTERLLANSHQQKKALMQQLLTGKTRLPGFEGAWRSECFGKLFDLQIGKTPSRNNNSYWDVEKVTDNRWVTISDMKDEEIHDTKEYISDLAVEKCKMKIIPEGSVIISFKLSIGKKSLLKKSCYTNEAICALRIRDYSTLHLCYMYHALSVVNYDLELDQAVKGKTLNKDKLTRLQMKFPPLPEQKAIAVVLTAADDEIAVLEKDLARLRAEKKALMQQLLTGKRRVKVA